MKAISIKQRIRYWLGGGRTGDLKTPEEKLRSVREKYNEPEEVGFHVRRAKAGLEPWEREFVERHTRGSGRVLNVGCGAGREAVALRQRGFEVVGIDPAERMVEEARRVAGEKGLPIAFSVRSATDLGEDLGRFDAIVFSAAVYSYIPTRKLRIKALASCGSLLLPGGRMVFSAYLIEPPPVGSRRWWKQALWRVARILGSEPGETFHRRVSEASNPATACFVYEFTSPREVLDEIARAGLQVIEAFRWEGLGIWIVRGRTWGVGIKDYGEKGRE